MAHNVLIREAMKTAVLVATGVLAISATASAGGYVGLAVGTEPNVNDELANRAANPTGRSLRLLGGNRFANNLSIEGALNGFGVITNNRGEKNLYQLSVAARMNLPLGNNFEGFGRLGVEHTWLDMGDDRYNLGGNGFLIGAGVEYKLDIAAVNASLFVDYTIHHATLADTRDKVDATSGMWGLGFIIGF